MARQSAGYAGYWARRALQREAVYQAGGAKASAAMRRIYDRAFDDVNAQIRSIERRMESRVGADAEGAAAYAVRLDMLETLKRRIDMTFRRLRQTEGRAAGDWYAEAMREGYGRMMFDIQKGVGLLFDFAHLPRHAIREAMQAGWLGRNYSKSIWKNTAKLAEQAQGIVTGGMLSGASIQTMTNQLDALKGTGQYICERLIRSETSYFANQGEMRAYAEAGIRQYAYLATLDDVTSKTCIALDGETFDVADAKAGVNCPPMHAFCRSTTVARFDDEALEGIRRRARDPATGAYMTVPATMNYGAWRAKIAEGGDVLTRRLGSGNVGDTDGHTTLDGVKAVDFNDAAAVMRELERFAESYAHADREHALIVSPNGMAYSFTGTAAAVNPGIAGGDALAGSVGIHNHPVAHGEEMGDSFSYDDLRFAAKHGQGRQHLVSGSRRNAFEFTQQYSEDELNEAWKAARNAVREHFFVSGIVIENEQEEVLRFLNGTLEGFKFYENF